MAHEGGSEITAELFFHTGADGVVIAGKCVGTDGQTFGVSEGAGTADPDELRVISEAGELAFEALGGHGVVGVVPGDELAAGEGEEFVSRDDEAVVFAGEGADAGVVLGEFFRSADV